MSFLHKLHDEEQMKCKLLKSYYDRVLHEDKKSFCINTVPFSFKATLHIALQLCDVANKVAGLLRFLSLRIISAYNLETNTFLPNSISMPETFD